MLVNYGNIVNQIIDTDVSRYKKGVMKDSGDELTDLEKLIYSEDRLPLTSHLVVGDIVVKLFTIKEGDLFITSIGMTNGHPILMNSDVDVTDVVVLNKTDDIFYAINIHNMYTSLICKINREQLKKFPQIVNITNM
jgi:hypothetical protein